MEYAINYTSYAGSTSHSSLVGIEIQPPIGEVAASGLINLMIHLSKYNRVLEGGILRDGHLARNDQAGTVLFFEAVEGHDEKKSLDAVLKAVPKLLSTCIDPCSLHEVNIISKEKSKPESFPPSE